MKLESEHLPGCLKHDLGLTPEVLKRFPKLQGLMSRCATLLQPISDLDMIMLHAGWYMIKHGCRWQAWKAGYLLSKFLRQVIILSSSTGLLAKCFTVQQARH